jgi:hypothetical protein
VNMFVNVLGGLSWQESVIEGAFPLFKITDPLTTCETNCRIGTRIAGLPPIS